MILHITTVPQWEEALSRGIYHHQSLTEEGFIHCSDPEQILSTANAYYRGQPNLLLLCISPKLLKASLVYEDKYDKGEAFPHIYGSLNLDAVVQLFDFPANDDGSFSLPEDFQIMGRLDEETDSPAAVFRGQPYPILEFDPAQPAVLEPSQLLPAIDIAPNCVLCFFQDVLSDLNDKGQFRQIYELGSERGPNPVYEMLVDGQRLAVVHAGVGAPLSAGFMDELIALGCRKFIACGGCGVLDEKVGLGHAVIPVSAVRDEGTSYHYLPAAREVTCSPKAVSALRSTLERHAVPYVLGKTWTTDAPYRETPKKVALRKSEGCLTVEMETAAFCAVAEFRGVTFGQILYGGDDLTGENWDGRRWQSLTSTREKLFWLAVESCLKL